VVSISPRTGTVCRGVAHSLSEAESVGIVHRDIKPANIILCRYGEDYDFVKVLDFGIAKALRAAAGPAPEATRDPATMDHVVQGTPAFIAPEQALGGSVDHRADIYATGCLAYWLLTGQLVFTADTAMQLIVHHAKTPPAPPSSRSEMPIAGDFDRLVMDCLAKDPNERPQHARDLLMRINELSLPAWTEDCAQGWWHVHLPRG
jgi:serine/threonine-protein kinase